MATTARLGIDITATNRTAAAFNSTQRSMQALQRSVGTFKSLFAGMAGGGALAGFTASLIRANRDVPAVKQSFENLNASYDKFAKAVGAGGLNAALINFSTRLGGMMAGTDNLAASIGRLLGAGVTGLAYLFEGIGRSLAFVSDNMAIFSRAAGVFIAYKLGQQVAWTGLAFLRFAAAIKSTTTIMGIFSVVTSIGKRGLVGLAVAGALIATTFEDASKYIDSLVESLGNAMGPIGDTVRKTLQGLGFDTKALNAELAGMVAFGSGVDSTFGKTDKTLKGFGRSIKVLDGNMKEFKESATSEAFDSIKNSVSGLSSSLVQVAQGTTSLKDAFSSTITSLIQDLTRLFVNQAFMSFLAMFGGAALPAPVKPGVGPGGMGFLHYGSGRASGGPVARGTAYTVGERGPELFVPGTSGTIIPPRSGGDGYRKVVINNYGGGQVRQEERQGPNGQRQLDVYIEGKIARFMGGDKGARVMGAKFGLQPKTTRR